MSDAITIRWVESCDAIDSSLWKRTFAPPLEGDWWYRAMERSGLEDQFKFFYGILSRAGIDVGIAPCFLTDVPMDLVAPPVVAAVLNFFGRIIPRLRYQRTLFIGSPCSDEGTIGLCDRVSLADVALPLLNAAKVRAKESRTPMIVWKDFPGSDEPELRVLIDRGKMFRLESYPGTRVPLPSGGFQGYLKSISSSHRHNLKKKLKRGAATGALIPSVITRPDAGTLAEIFALFWQTYEKGSTKFEKLNIKFFEEIAACDVAHWVILRHASDNRMAAFMLCFLLTPRAINKFIGLDYTLEGDWFLYFRLWEQAVIWASAAGATEFQSGQTGYRAKLDLDHELVPLVNYCRHRNPLIHRIFAFVAKGINWATLDHDLATFLNSRRQAASNASPLNPTERPGK